MPIAKMDIRRNEPPENASTRLSKPPPPPDPSIRSMAWRSMPGTGICAPTAKISSIPNTKVMRFRNSGIDQARWSASIILLRPLRLQGLDGSARRDQFLLGALAELVCADGEFFGDFAVAEDLQAMMQITYHARCDQRLRRDLGARLELLFQHVHIDQRIDLFVDRLKAAH